MKRLFISILIICTLASCVGKAGKSSENKIDGPAISTIDWMGSYESDSVRIDFKKDGFCEVIVNNEKLTGDYSWDVDGSTICVVDAHQTIYLLEVHDGFLITPDTNTKYNKIK